MNKIMIDSIINVEIRKKILCLFLTITIILSITIGVAKCVPVTEYIDGLKIFSDGVTVKNGNLTVTDANSVAKFSVDPNGSITAAADTDTTFTFGRGKMGYDGTNSDYFAIGHYDNFDANSYCLKQKANGSTTINAKSGASLGFDIGGVGYSYMNSTAMYLHALNIQNGSGASITYEGTGWHGLGINRNSSSNTAGNYLTIYAGGCALEATDKAGGNLLLKSGITTGNGGSQVDIYAVTANQGAGTTDRNPALSLSVLGDGVIIQGGLYTKKYSGSLADDATITLPAITSGGMLKVWTEAEYAEYFIKSDGSVEYIRLSANSDDISNDGYLCCYDGGSTAVIANKLGSEKTVNYVLEYK